MTAPIVLVGVIASVVVYHTLQDVRSERRVRDGQCVRCGIAAGEFDDLTAEDHEPAVPLLMCTACALRTRRNHRWAFNTLLALIILYGAQFVYTVLTDVRNGGSYSLRELSLLFAPFGIPAYGLFRIFPDQASRIDSVHS